MTTLNLKVTGEYYTHDGSDDKFKTPTNVIRSAHTYLTKCNVNCVEIKRITTHEAYSRDTETGTRKRTIRIPEDLYQFIQAKADKQTLIGNEKPSWTKALIECLRNK